MTRKTPPADVRLASPQQLWTLNRYGWLHLRDRRDVNGEITAAKADEAIQRSISLEAEKGKAA